MVNPLDELFFILIQDLDLELLYLAKDKIGFRLYVRKKCEEVNLSKELADELIERLEDYFNDAYGNRKGD